MRESPPATSLDTRSNWKISDDTLLTLATCKAIIHRQAPEPDAIAQGFTALYNSGALTGLGASTMKALIELSHGGHWALVGRKGAMSAGNGAAMRIAPVAFFINPSDESHRKTIRDICRITRHNDEAYAGALAVAISVRSAYDGVWSSGGGLLNLLLERLPDTSVRDRLSELSAMDPETPLAEVGERFGSSGYVVESVPLAILGASRLLTLGFRQVLDQLVMIGGDTDTIASMAGQIMGCVIGRSGIPADMALRTPCYDRITEVASQLADLATTCENEGLATSSQTKLPRKRLPDLQLATFNLQPYLRLQRPAPFAKGSRP
jgi:ADP-ribosylglycohydrolase